MGSTDLYPINASHSRHGRIFVFCELFMLFWRRQFRFVLSSEWHFEYATMRISTMTMEIIHKENENIRDFIGMPGRQVSCNYSDTTGDDMRGDEELQIGMTDCSHAKLQSARCGWLSLLKEMQMKEAEYGFNLQFTKRLEYHSRTMVNRTWCCIAGWRNL